MWAADRLVLPSAFQCFMLHVVHLLYSLLVVVPQSLKLSFPLSSIHISTFFPPEQSSFSPLLLADRFLPKHVRCGLSHRRSLLYFISRRYLPHLRFVLLLLLATHIPHASLAH